MPTSPAPNGFVAAVVVAPVEVAVALVAELVLLDLLLPQAASTKAPKLAAPAPPTIFRNRLRSWSSRTSCSTMPAGCRASSSSEVLRCDPSLVGAGMSDTSVDEFWLRPKPLFGFGLHAVVTDLT